MFEFREREREREQINNYRQEIKAGSGQFVSYQHLIFDLCWVHQQKLIQLYELNNQNLDYLKKQWLTWQLGQANLTWLAKNIKKTINELKPAPSIHNLYNSLTIENPAVKDLEELLEKVNESFSNGKSFEEHLNFQLLEHGTRLSRREVENFISNTSIENDFIWAKKDTDWEPIIEQLERELKAFYLEQPYCPSWEESQNDLEIADDLLANKNTLISQKNKKLKNKEREKKELQDKLNASKKVNKKTWLVGAGLTAAWLTNNYYNPGCFSQFTQLSTFNNSTNSSLNPVCPIWENPPNNGSNSNAQPGNQLQLNCQTNPTQLYTSQGYPVSFNSTHSWKENPLLQNFSETITPTSFDITGNIDDIAIDFDNTVEELLEKEIELSNKPIDYDKIVKERDTWKEKYEQAELKLSELPSNWKSELAKIKELEEKVSELEKRPTQENYNKLKNNQRPIDLPPNLKSELASIPKLKKKIKKQKAQINNLKSRPNITLEEFAKYKSPEQVAKIEQTIRKEFEDYINPADQTKIITIARQAGYQFKQADIDKAIDEKDKEWKEKGLVNPHNQTEADQAGLIKKSEYEQIKQERDNRPNITLDDYDKLKNNQRPPGLPENWKSELTKIPNLEKEIKDLQLRPNISQNQWDVVQDDLEQTEQAKRALEIAYQKKVDEVKELNKINQDNSTFTKDLIVWIDNSQPQTAGQIQTGLMVLREKHSPSASENNNWQSLLITNLGTLLISQWKNRVDSKKFQQERTKLQQQINQTQQAQQQAENERDITREELVQERHSHAITRQELDKVLSSQRNSEKARLIQKENELSQANQKINKYQTKLNEQEKNIVQQLNNSLKLGLDNPNLEQVIGRIQELINKPPLTYEEYSSGELQQQLNQAQQTIACLEKELKNTPFREDLNTIKELELQSLEELFGKGDNLWKQQIQQATSYQQVAQARQDFIQEQLNKQQSFQAIEQPKETIQPVNKEKAILISLLVISLVSIGGLLVKLREKKEK